MARITRSSSFTSYHNLAKKGENRRIWLEGEPLLRAGFMPGDFFRVELNVNTLAVSLTHVPDSPEARKAHARKELRKVSRRDMGTWVKPIVDVCNADITGLFGEFARFRAQTFAGRIEFGIHPEDLAQARREKAFLANAQKGEIRKADAFLGLGLSSDAVAQGFANEGIKTKQIWAVEMEARYLDIACLNSPERYQDAHMFCGKVEEVEKHLLEPVDAFSFSMACTNHSRQGKTKKKLATAEMGDEVTSLFGVVEMIRAANPAVMFSENVPDAMGSVTYELLKKELSRLGYVCHDMILDQSHSGAIDRRRRYWMVAYSKGLNVNVESLMPATRERTHQTFGEFMEDPQGDGVWHDAAKLQKRQDINLAAGRNFTMKKVKADTTIVNTIPRNYTKHQVSNPHVFNEDESKYRLITINEHAHMKLIPPHLVQNCSATTAHEGMGQGIAYLHGVGVAEGFMRSVSFNNDHTQQRLPL